MAVIVVRRGLSGEYYRFLQVFAAARGVEIIIDRREGERRESGSAVAVERRLGDRRRAPPKSWETADFALVEDDPRPDPESSAPQPDTPRRGAFWTRWRRRSSDSR